MEYTKLGRTGLLISRVLLGGWNFGKVTDKGESHRMMSAALDVGINVIDTANKYGRGASEEIIGSWLSEDPGRRDKVIVATKVFGEIAHWPNDGRLSARHVRRAVEESLRRLRVDYIDLYQLHHIDRETPWEEIWQAMEQLVTQGKIVYVGSSNHAGWHLAQGQEAALKRHFLGLVSEQCLYNLAERTAEQEVIPAARAYGLAVLPWSPLHGGMLAGILDEGSESGQRRRRGRAVNFLQYRREQVQKYEALCVVNGLRPAEVALAWLLTRSEVTAPIVGPRTMEQLTSCFNALELRLPPVVLTKLEEIFPGPGVSPESFAW